jgi:hypothetical protein
MDCELGIEINTPEIHTRGKNNWHTKQNPKKKRGRIYFSPQKINPSPFLEEVQTHSNQQST